jgi:hypothetical protein
MNSSRRLSCSLFLASTNPQIRALKDGGRKRSGSKKGGSGALSALINPPPGYDGDFSLFGTATLRCNPDESFLLHINAQGLDASCDSYKVAIYAGASCEIPGSDFFYEEEVVDNTYFAYGGGLSNSAFSFTNGYTCDENKGWVVIIYDSSPEIIGCGVLGKESTDDV